MSIAGDLKALAGRLEPLGEDGMRLMETVFANPEAVDVLADVAAACGYNLPPGTITAFGAGFKGFLSAISPAPAQHAQQQQRAAVLQSGLAEPLFVVGDGGRCDLVGVDQRLDGDGDPG